MIYFVCIFLIFIGIYKYDYCKTKVGYRKLYYIILTLFVAISGFGYRLGIDSVYFYMPYYDYVKSSWIFDLSKILNSEFQPGWVLFCCLSKTLSSEYFVMKLFHAFIVNFVIFHTIKTYTRYVFTVILFYFCCKYFYFNFEILRESLAIAVFLLIVKYYINSVWKKYFLGAFAATMFHISAFFLIILPFFKWIKVTKKIFFLVSITGICMMLFSAFIFPYFSFLSNIGMFAAKTEAYMQSETFGTTATIDFSLLKYLTFFAFIPLYMLWLFHKKNIDIKYSPLILAFIVIRFIALSFPILFRLNNYLYIFLFLFYIESIIYITKVHLPKFKKIGVVGLSLLFIYADSASSFRELRDSGYKQYHLYYPYSSVFDKSLDAEREALLYEMRWY